MAKGTAPAATVDSMVASLAEGVHWALFAYRSDPANLWRVRKLRTGVAAGIATLRAGDDRKQELQSLLRELDEALTQR